MISHEHRLIFIHIPKAAGTSIEAALGHHGPDAEIVRDAQDHRTLRQLQWPRGGPATVRSRENLAESLRAARSLVVRQQHAANRVRVTRAQYASYLKFAVVRNPWARTWSWYRNVVTDDLHRARLGVPADMDFAAFVRAQIGRDSLRPQTYWLHDFRGRIGVDIVCRFEELARDFARVCEQARLAPVALPRLNEGSSGGHYRDAYDDATKTLVAQRFHEEITAFDYRFDTGARS